MLSQRQPSFLLGRHRQWREHTGQRLPDATPRRFRRITVSTSVGLVRATHADRAICSSDKPVRTVCESGRADFFRVLHDCDHGFAVQFFRVCTAVTDRCCC